MQDLTPFTSETAPPTHDRLDIVGITVSAACLVHCLATPLLVLFLPMLGQIFASPHTHLLLATILIPIAMISLIPGYRRHKRLRAMALGLSGLTLLTSALLYDHFVTGQHDCAQLFHLTTGSVTHFLGSILLVSSHILNIRDGYHLCHR